MDQVHNPIVLSRKPDDLAKLIQKLRWIGLEDEAHQLQLAMLTLPPEQRVIVSAGPLDID